MGKKSLKRRKQVVGPTRLAQAHCPYCGSINSEKSALSLMDQLFRSHAELCATLRSAGRRLLQFEQQGDESLDSIRKVLRRAENVRKVMQSRGEMPDAPKDTEEDKLVAETPLPDSNCSPDKVMNEVPVGKSVRQKLPRQRSLRLIRFPIG
jgi:hypothetical protein